MDSTVEFQSKEIESFAEQTKAVYDGWGSDVEK
jgi:regulator of RNase E activity RraB